MRKLIIVLGVIFYSSIVFGQKEENTILGKWLTGDKKAHIEVYKCQDKFCGKIVWLLEQNNENTSHC